MLVDSENRKEQNMNDWKDVERELSAEMLNAIRQGMQKKGISLTMLAFNMFGDGLRDAFDPRLRR